MEITGQIVEQIKDKINCCACGRPLKNSKWINLCETNKIATWNYPKSRNVFIPNAPSQAVAIVCDDCMKTKLQPISAIELEPGQDGFGEVIYHALEELEDVPDWVRRAEEKLSRPSQLMN